jgi:hypothetical protein
MTIRPEWFIPINFTLTDRAREYIRTAVQRDRDKTGTDSVGAICWLQGGSGPNGTWLDDINVPCLGIDERARLADAIQELDGLELVFNVPRKIAPRFEGQVIDFTEDAGLHFVRGERV